MRREEGVKDGQKLIPLVSFEVRLNKFSGQFNGLNIQKDIETPNEHLKSEECGWHHGCGNRL